MHTRTAGPTSADITPATRGRTGAGVVVRIAAVLFCMVFWTFVASQFV